MDTNVVVSGVLTPHGPPGRIVDLVVAGVLRCLYDDRILLEYREVLSRPKFGFDPEDVSTLVERLEATGERVTPAVMPLELPHAADLPFAQVAQAGAASALVTGNGRHFVPTRGRLVVPVVTPADFLERLAGAGSREQDAGRREHRGQQ